MTEASPFRRDRLTVTVYAMSGVFGYAVASLGPAMPLLRDDLAISRTIGGLHFTAVAAGAVAAGFVVERLVRRWGRHRTFWVAAALVAVGALLIGSGRQAAATLGGAVIVGGAGSALLATGQSSLSDRHGRYRTVALAEGNAATSVGSVFPGLVIGWLVASGIGWRFAFAVPAALFVAGALLRGRHPFPPTVLPASGAGGRRLPRPYWIYWAALIPAVGAEWSVVAWAAGYMVEVSGMAEATASTLMTLFFGAMVAGRLVGSRLARTVDPLAILVASAVGGVVGTLLFWGSGSQPMIVIGLFVTGLGISTLFPMLLSLAVDVASDRPDIATARVPIGAGSSVIIAPLALGWLADRWGIRAAFGVVPALLVMVVVVAVTGRRAMEQSP